MNTIEALQKILEFDSQVHMYGMPLTEQQIKECDEIISMFSDTDDIELAHAIVFCLEIMSDSEKNNQARDYTIPYEVLA